jgi:glutathione synthase/RimK-type ligase-like ATP-grasp enzyme
MNKNIQTLIKACNNKKISYSLHHKSNNLITVFINNKEHLFLNWATPLNNQAIVKLCQDKDYFYSFYNDVIKMPKTSSFLNPYSDEKYIQYLNEKTIYEIISNIEKTHSFPFIIKKNSGSWGTNVFKVNSFRELESSVLSVFNMNSAAFDYVCLAQDIINIKQEFRVIYLNGEYQFSYEKVFAENFDFSKELSPFSDENTKAKFINDKNLIDKLNSFCRPIFDKLTIPFCGLDVAVDVNGDFWLIEANSAPGFDKIIRDEGDDLIIKLYEKILAFL